MKKRETIFETRFHPVPDMGRRSSDYTVAYLMCQYNNTETLSESTIGITCSNMLPTESTSLFSF